MQTNQAMCCIRSTAVQSRKHFSCWISVCRSWQASSSLTNVSLQRCFVI